MELDELELRLVPFVQDRYGDSAASVHEVHKMPGHAGFAYGFTVESRGERESWFLRLPPPNVRWEGTADVIRQVTVLRALDGSDVPHCPVKWYGSEGRDLEWFARPWFVVPQLPGDVLRLEAGGWGEAISDDAIESIGRQAMHALAGIHRIDWRGCGYLGEPVPFEEDVTRWDRLLERAADPEALVRAPEVRRRLLETIPQAAPIGVFHGDFQAGNLFCSHEADLLAVIDFELTGIGATSNDLGWICTFADRDAWAANRASTRMLLDPDTLVALYEEAWGEPVLDVSWYRALAAYKFALISGFNLMLHRRGKRHDPVWEETALSMRPLIDRALELLQR